MSQKIIVPRVPTALIWQDNCLCEGLNSTKNFWSETESRERLEQIDYGSGVLTSHESAVHRIYNAISPKNIRPAFEIDKKETFSGYGNHSFIFDDLNGEDFVFYGAEALWETIFLSRCHDKPELTTDEFYNLCKQLFSDSNDVFRLAVRVLFNLGYEYNFVKQKMYFMTIVRRHEKKNSTNFKLAKALNQLKVVPYPTCLYGKNSNFIEEINSDLDFSGKDYYITSQKHLLLESLAYFIGQKKYFQQEFLNEKMFNAMIEKYKQFVFFCYNIVYGIDLGICAPTQ